MRLKIIVSLLILGFTFGVDVFSFEFTKTLSLKCEEYYVSNFNIRYITNEMAIIDVNLGQIHILSRIEISDGQVSKFYFSSTDDLGRGGMGLNWDKFSKTKPIMVLKKISQKRYLGYWHGFYDNEKSKYVWKNDADIIVDEAEGPEKGSSYLYECEPEKDKDLDRTFHAVLLETKSKNRRDDVFLIKSKHRRKIIRAKMISQNIIKELPKKFSMETRFSNIRFLDLQQTYLATFTGTDNKWIVNYCWDVFNDGLYFAAKKMGSEKIYYSKNIGANSQCPGFIKN